MRSTSGLETFVGFLIRVWKPLPIRQVLKFQGEVQRGQYLLVVGLSCYKLYQSQTPGGNLSLSDAFLNFDGKPKEDNIDRKTQVAHLGYLEKHINL